MTEEIKWASVPMNELIELRDERDRLKQENKELKECTNTAIIEQEKLLSQLNAVREENKENIHYLACMTEQRNKLKTTLEEIRNDIMTKETVCTECIKIAKRINEVLND